jgi:hypothetical protein
MGLVWFQIVRSIAIRIRTQTLTSLWPCIECKLCNVITVVFNANYDMLWVDSQFASDDIILMQNHLLIFSLFYFVSVGM